MSQSLTDPRTHWESLLAAARAGDDDALGQICERLREYLLLMVGAVGAGLSGKLDASDVVQQAMLEAHRDFSTFCGSSEREFRVWLKRLVEHTLVDATRRYRRTRCRDVSRELSIDQRAWPPGLASREGTASSILCRRETDEELLRAIVRLPERRRRIIEMRHQQGLSYAEIAERLEMTESAARKLWSRTVQALRQELTADHGFRPARPN